jgi:methyltransferase-like protein/ubiquinone/menaquinone biosynthesis C-methylase UbiE
MGFIVLPFQPPDILISARLCQSFPLQPARIERARVLELGCGDGNNLITMACTLPESQFQGVDLATEPVRSGQKAIAEMGLKNISLRQLNILEMPADIGTFDYIIAHGLFSWVPEAVQEKILAICREHLAENGVAYISYNAYPGCHLRELARGMMRFHVRQFSEPLEQVGQARALLKFLAEGQSASGLWQDVLRHLFERLEKRTDSGFYHDDLSPVYRPLYFHEFVEAASRHQLEYLAEADVKDMLPGGLNEEGVRVLRKMEQMNRVAHEQYMDFLVGRAFRQTLLCRQGRRLDQELKPERVFSLFVASDVAAVNPDANLATPAMEDFKRGESVIASGNPMLKSALLYLGQAWPRRVPFDELLQKARERAGREASSAEPALESDRRDLADFLFRCYAIGFVDLHSYPSTFVTEVSERPMASALVRWQIRQGPSVSSFRHLSLKIGDPLGREVLTLLDGTRDRAALLKELGEIVKTGSMPIYYEGKSTVELEKALELLPGQLDTSLASLARLGLLVR